MIEPPKCPLLTPVDPDLQLAALTFEYVPDLLISSCTICWLIGAFLRDPYS